MGPATLLFSHHFSDMHRPPQGNEGDCCVGDAKRKATKAKTVSHRTQRHEDECEPHSSKAKKKAAAPTIDLEYVAAIRNRRIKASVYGKRKAPPPKRDERKIDHSRENNSNDDGVPDLKAKARALRMQASRKVSLDNTENIKDEMKHGNEKLERQDSDDASDTSLQLEELFGENFPYQPETQFQRRVSGSISSMSSFFESFKTSEDTTDDFYSSLVEVVVPGRKMNHAGTSALGDKPMMVEANERYLRRTSSDSSSLGMSEAQVKVRKKHSHKRRAKARTELRKETSEPVLPNKVNTPKRRGGRTPRDTEDLKAKARALRIKTRETCRPRSKSVSLANAENTHAHTDPKGKVRSHRTPSSTSSLPAEPPRPAAARENDIAYSYPEMVDEPHETAAERLSFSSMSKYFGGLRIHQKSDDTIEDKSDSSVQRSIESSIDSDKRHLLYLGQLPNEQSMARMVVHDSHEWKKFQKKMKESGVITNEGARQILNPLLDQAEKEHKTRKPPPVIFVGESGVGHATPSG